MAKTIIIDPVFFIMSSVFSTISLSLTHSLSDFAKKEKTANRSIATGRFVPIQIRLAGI